MTEVEMLRSEVDRLQKMVTDLESKMQAVPRTGLGSVTQEIPIWDYRNTNDPARMDDVVFAYRYDRTASDAWKPFTMLAKALCKPDPLFYMGVSSLDRRTPDVKWNTTTIPARFDNIPFEKLSLAGQMIDEMIQIWNRYYKMVHKTAKYRSNRELKEAEIMDQTSANGEGF